MLYIAQSAYTNLQSKERSVFPSLRDIDVEGMEPHPVVFMPQTNLLLVMTYNSELQSLLEMHASVY